MAAGAELLEQLVRNKGADDERGIRLDLTRRMLQLGLEADRFAVGGAHIATPEEVQNNYAEGALVPDEPEPLTSQHYGLLKRFLANKNTPGSLRIGYGALPEELDIDAALAEATSPGFTSYHGRQLYDLGRYGSGCLIGMLENKPEQPDTILVEDHGEHLTEDLPIGEMFGIHYDVSGEQPPDGWIERLPRSERLRAGKRLAAPVKGKSGPRKALAGLNFSALQLADEYQPDNPDFLPRAPHLTEYCARNPKRLAEMTILWTEYGPGEVAEIVPANAAHSGSLLGCSEPSTALIFTMSNSFRRVG
ncbi:MAG TPA: hypothetical protein VGM08_00890 [Candidatus Saccharimonadales bacterium]|jgi:hypothetical protein